jgi:hypothetical protein
VIGYDTLGAAFESARERLEKNPLLELWITDATKRLLLDGSGIRKRLTGGGPADPR